MFYWTIEGSCRKGFMLFSLSSLVIMLISCNNGLEKRVVYYPIDSLVSAQIKLLTNSKASVKKVALLGGNEAKTSFTPADTNQWIQELEIFRELEVINKPINKGAYVVEDLKDNKSNLRLTSITAQSDLPVRYLKIYYQGSKRSVRRIESKYTEKNSMYDGTRYLVMEFNNINNKPILTKYTISGGQEMFLGDSVQYTINATVFLPNK